MTNPTDLQPQPGPEAVSDSDVLGQMIGSYFNENVDSVVVVPPEHQHNVRYAQAIKITDGFEVLRGQAPFNLADISKKDPDAQLLATAIEVYFMTHPEEIKETGKRNAFPLQNLRLLPLVKGEIVLVDTNPGTTDTE